MGVRMVSCDERGVRLTAPLVASINHPATVFGGSASALAILAAWTYRYFVLKSTERSARLVIQSNMIDYLAPNTADFESECAAKTVEELERFVKMLRRHGKARITVAAVLTCGG